MGKRQLSWATAIKMGKALQTNRIEVWNYPASGGIGSNFFGDSKSYQFLGVTFSV
jgi:hypothetical protein